jgi:hypothetical protein
MLGHGPCGSDKARPQPLTTGITICHHRKRNKTSVTTIGVRFGVVNRRRAPAPPVESAVATRTDKLAIAYQAALHLAGILAWTRR